MIESFILVLIFVLCFVLYFLPWLIARKRHMFLPWLIAQNRRLDSNELFFLINLLLGWTLVGWVVCLAWAAFGRTEAQRECYASANAPPVVSRNIGYAR